MLDDRAQPVTILRRAGFCPWPASGDRRIGVLRAQVRAAMQGERSARNRASRMLRSGTRFAVQGIFCALVMGAMFWMGMTLANLATVVAGMCAIGFVLDRSTFRFARRSSRESIIPVVLLEGMCPSCGYNLCGVEAAEDGCVVCPECGSAWREDRMRRREPFIVAAPLSPSIDDLFGPRQAYLVVSDDCGRRIVLPKGLLIGKEPAHIVSDDPDAISRVRQLLRGQRWIEAVGVIGIAAALFGLAIGGKIVEDRWSNSTPVSWTAATTALCLITLGVVGVIIATKRQRIIVARDLIHEDICAGCLLSLKTAPSDATGLRTCSSCSAAWTPNGGGSEAIRT